LVDRDQVLQRIVTEILVELRKNDYGRRAHVQQRIAVGRRMCHGFGGNDAAGAGTVVDHDLPPQRVAQP
jgi:hypothetical protein